MALTLSIKTEKYNTLRTLPLINKEFAIADQFKTHKQADAAFQSIYDFCRSSDKFLVSYDKDNLPVPVAIRRDEKPPKPEKTVATVAALPLTSTPDQDETASLIKLVIQSETLSGIKWYNTGDWVFARKSSFTDVAADNRKKAAKLLDDGSTFADIPELGEDKDGNFISIRKGKTGKGGVKWSAWILTRRWSMNLADIFKAIEVSGWDLVFPDGKLVNRTDLANLSKKESSGEAPVATFKRSILLAQKKMEEELTKQSDKSIVSALIADLNSAYSDWIK